MQGLLQAAQLLQQTRVAGGGQVLQGRLQSSARQLYGAASGITPVNTPGVMSDQTSCSCTYPMLLCPGIVMLRCEQGNISGLGNPPDIGIMEGGAEASTLIERCQRNLWE